MYQIPQYQFSSDDLSGWIQGGTLHGCLPCQRAYEDIDNGGICGVLFLDLAKAFDTVDHLILGDKLKLLGFEASVQSWFKSYLLNRNQSTKVGNSLSSYALLNCGVAQGSILGPLTIISLLCE